MQRIATLGSVCMLLLGCGGSTEIVLGNSLALTVDEAPSGRNVVAMKLGLRACRPAKLAISWGGPGPAALLARTAVETCPWSPPAPA